MNVRTTRRGFLHASVLSSGLMVLPWRNPSVGAADEAPQKKLPIAAITTVYRPSSHADVIIGKVLEGWRQDGGAGPDLQLMSLYVDQKPDSDLSGALSAKHGFPLAKTIADALTLGTGKLAVEGVLIVAEHGEYPIVPKTEQVIFPKRRFFDEVAAVFRASGRSVPVFSDKHLAHNWEDARHIYDLSRELKFPLMAGSSVPLWWRNPSANIPVGAEVSEAMALGYGPLEHYGFHALEGMQCLLERRKGGETGVKSVQAVRGEGIWQAEKAGRWSKSLFDTLVVASPGPYSGKVAKPKEMAQDAVFYLIEYRDGTKGTVAMGTGYSHDFTAAVTIRGQSAPFLVTYVGDEQKPYRHFEHLLRAAETMFHSGRASYPVERTLLTTGVLDAALRSLADDSHAIETPYLDIGYEPVDWPFATEDRPMMP